MEKSRQWEKLLPQRTEIAYLVLGVFAAKADSNSRGEKTVSAKDTELHVSEYQNHRITE